jgi:hypothetical protein
MRINKEGWTIMRYCGRCAKLREDWLRVMDQHTVDRRPQVETMEARKREESAS